MDKLTFSTKEASLDGSKLSGVAHTYGTTTLRDGSILKFAPGAFSKVLRDPATDVVALWNHNTDYPLGRQSAGTLTLSDEDDGLHFHIDMPEVSYAEDLRVLIDRGDVNGMSFSVNPGKATVSKTSDGSIVRTYENVTELIDISPVTLPAFAGTTLSRFTRSYENESIKSQITRAKNRARRQK